MWNCGSWSVELGKFWCKFWDCWASADFTVANEADSVETKQLSAAVFWKRFFWRVKAEELGSASRLSHFHHCGLTQTRFGQIVKFRPWDRLNRRDSFDIWNSHERKQKSWVNLPQPHPTPYSGWQWWFMGHLHLTARAFCLVTCATGPRPCARLFNNYLSDSCLTDKPNQSELTLPSSRGGYSKATYI